MSEAVTHDIRVQVVSQYLENRSLPTSHQYYFVYTIRISNESQKTVQLLSRHWLITHGNGKIEEVKGEGVVGLQPVIHPGESFEYHSGCLLETSHGTMEGSYQFVGNTGELFNAQIPIFILAVPYSLH